MADTVKRVFFRAHGSVQGVNYRYFTKKKANEYHVSGWVRNTSNGKVEGEAQGTEEALQKLLSDLDDGPRHAHVVKLEKKEIDVVDNEESFEVRA